MQPKVEAASAAVSLVSHLLMLAAFSTVLRSCVAPIVGDGPGAVSPDLAMITVAAEFTERPADPAPIEPPAAETTEADIAETSDETIEANEADEAAEAAETGKPEQQMAAADQPLLRPLSANDANATPHAAVQVAASPAAGPASPRRPPRRVARLPAAETGLFGIRDRAYRLLYVIDRSASMGDDDAMRVAKAELSDSIGRLEPTQRFQILFYNTALSALRPPPGAAAREGYFTGSDEHRGLARRQWQAVQPAGGTDHLGPLVAALAYEPDVIFFLTDADEPGLTLAELDDLRRRNNGRCRIHCIEFGRGKPIGTQFGFLSKVASQSGGEYVYRDTTRF